MRIAEKNRDTKETKIYGKDQLRWKWEIATLIQELVFSIIC